MREAGVQLTGQSADGLQHQEKQQQQQTHTAAAAAAAAGLMVYCYCTQPMKVVVPASVYCLKSSGNVELFRKYTEQLDPGVCRWIRRASQSSLALSAQPLGLSPARCGAGEFTEAGPTYTWLAVAVLAPYTHSLVISGRFLSCWE
jgi:hypothetical protein